LTLPVAKARPGAAGPAKAIAASTVGATSSTAWSTGTTAARAAPKATPRTAATARATKPASKTTGHHPTRTLLRTLRPAESGAAWATEARIERRPRLPGLQTTAQTAGY